MKKMVYIIMTAMLFLTACGSANRVVVQPKALPSWYTHPPQSNAFELYAIGEGKEKKEAISNALTLLLSTLSVSISSNYSAKTIVKEGTHYNSSDATYVNETHSEVQKIKVTNYELLQSEKLGFKHYAVLIKVDKKQFFNGLKQDIEQQLNIIEMREQNIGSKNAIEQLAFYRQSLDSLKELQNSLAVMKVLEPKFSAESYLQRYERLRKKHDALLQRISFWVKSNYQPLAFPIAKGISAKKLTIKNRKDKFHFNVLIDADIKKASAYGFTLARANITIATQDAHANVIANNSLNLVGQSSQGYSIAKQDLVKKLNRLIEKEGIEKVLNLDI
ncbi:LPP20 family lipoprotein [Sulfurimonas paralvinellae]|uniref:Lipoprotein LPP20-like domain-containing protein n=1 Tax=Sulfurimonas paralvinellae TaxID=317658 RepID=A0A7M1B924_9BACT|nr:LPP20 family lipoprotein [Sulfurimonas paralvinellae]QOP45252.1 hypothetical protein FM071_02720 [Sulfurimonas paralvinellae]